MTTPLPNSVQPAVTQSLAIWHRMVAQHDLSDVPALLHPEALFRSPMAFKPYPGAGAVALILNTVLNVFEGFTYHREFASADGLNVVLEFSASVAGRQLKGVDLIRFDEAGLIVEFEVMIRPASGLQALGEAMGQRLAVALPALLGARPG